MSTAGTLFWTGVVLIGAVLLAPNLSDVAAPPPPPASGDEAVASPAPSVGNGLARQELLRSGDGHFYADAQVNGARIRFMIDTGASAVALTRADAQRAGIALGSQRAKAIGAGGEIEVIPVTIDRIALGSLTATQVRGAVVQEGLPVSLLGQTFLSQVGSVEIRGDTMVLR